jgi:hypothetical protein
MSELTGEDLLNAGQALALVRAAERFKKEGRASSQPGDQSSPDTIKPSFDEALKTLDDALGATIQHMREQDDGKITALTNKQIRDLWADAGQKLRFHDRELSNACMMKGNGWVDDKVWKRARAQNIKIDIEDMEKARMDLFGNQPAEPRIPRWFPIVGAIFAAVTVLFLMAVFFVGLPVDGSRRLILNVLVALCVAASGAFLGGTAAAKGKIPFFEKLPVEFSAAGGIGIFVVVLMIMKFAA